MMADRMQTTPQAVQIPPELLRSVPRQVALSRAGKASVGIAIALVLGALATAVALSVTAGRDAAHYQVVENDSAVTPGRVVAVGPVRDGKRLVHYSFVVDGREHSGQTTLQSRYWRRMPVGTPVQVRYLPAAPEENWLLGHQPQGVPYWVVGVAPLSLLVGPVAIFISLRKQRGLLAEGRPALARVTRLKRIQGHQAAGHRLGYTYTPGRHGAGYRVYYEFNDLSGAKHTGRANVGQNAPPEGSALVILYNIDEPRRNAPYPLPNVRIAD